MEQAGGHNQHETLKQAYRTAYLIAGHIRQTLTEEETDELNDWILLSRENMELFAELTDEKNIAASLERYEKIKVEEALAATKKHITFSKPRSTVRTWQYALAACVILAIGIFMYTRFAGTTKDDPVIAVHHDDIDPGNNEAVLLLPDGKRVPLAAGPDTLLQGKVEVLRNKGEIVYASSDAGSEYHTLTIPRKGQYKVILPDGTKVWLNSESSIKFPTAFNSSERKVFVTGETFFEVAHDASKPFRAVAGDITVEALGTQFNINAYTNEASLAATLVEGSVKVSVGTMNEILKPGEQSQWSGGALTKLGVDANATSAWRMNQFQFKNTSLDVIMRQIERWYDAKVIYKDAVNLHLNATIERNVPVSKLLHLLEATEQVHFNVEDNVITVSK